jgi:Phage integrase family
VRAGVDLITVQQLLGHARISMTARYAHSLSDARIAAVRQLEARGPVQPDPNRSQDSDNLVDVGELNSPLENNLGS